MDEKSKREVMNVCYAADHKYAPMMAASIASLIKNNPGREINFHILDCGLTDEDKRRLENLISKFSSGSEK